MLDHTTLCGLALLCCPLACAPELETDDGDGLRDGHAAQDGELEFEAQYLECDEFAGVGLVPIANVIDRVPDDYVVSEPVPGFAVVVAQAGSCAAIAIPGSSDPGTFAQFGVAVEAPTGTGTGNFYQLMFATDQPKLAKWLGRHANAAHTALTYEITPLVADGASLHVAVPEPSALAWQLDGPITLPDPNGAANPTAVFNYWSQTAKSGNVLQENTVTGIRVGDGTSVRLTPVGAEMQAIVGAPILVFPFFSKPEIFEAADLSVRSNVF